MNVVLYSKRVDMEEVFDLPEGDQIVGCDLIYPTGNEPLVNLTILTKAPPAGQEVPVKQ